MPEFIRKLEDAGVPDRVELREVDGADHFFRDLFGGDLADEIAAFLRRD